MSWNHLAPRRREGQAPRPRGRPQVRNLADPAPEPGGGGMAHLAVPVVLVPLVSPVLPVRPVILASGLVESRVWLAVVWPRTRALGGLAFAGLCAAYLPLHLWVQVRPDPVFAPSVAASLRVGVQGLLIWVGLVLWRHAGRAAH